MKIDYWKPESRILFLALAVLIVCILSYFAYGIFTYPDSVFPPRHLQEVITAEIPVRHFKVGLFDLKQMADNHIVYEYAYGGQPNYTTLSFYILLFFIAIGAVLLLSVATTVSRFRFILSMGVFIVFLTSLRLETLQIFGRINKMPLIAISIAYLSLAFYLHVFKNFNLNKRILAFSALTVLAGCFIYFGAQVKAPLMFVAVHSMGAGMLATLLFILIIAHEIVVFFIRLVGEVRERSLLHFLSITAIYLCVLLVAYLQNTGYISWGIWTPPTMLLIVISALLGIEGYRLREPRHDAVFQFPVNVIFYMALLLSSFGTLAFFFASANDLGITFFNNFGLYAHLGSGIIFLTYIIANFSPMLAQNWPVHTVLYKPTAMPYFSFRIAALITVYAFLAHHIGGYQVSYYFLGSYYNAVGAAYYKRHDLAAAQTCFQQAVYYRSLNHQARYTMAYIAAEKLEPEKEKKQYELAAKKNAAPYTFLNWSETYEREGNRDGALNALKEGLKKWPKSGDLYNGLGLLFAKNNISDTALFYFQKARLYADEGNTNLLACSAQMRAVFPADSLYSLTRSKSLGAQCNALALANFQAIKLSTAPPLPTDTILTAYQASALGNYFVNALGDTDTTWLNQTVKLATKTCNENFYEYLLLAAAHAYYQQGMTRKAFPLVRQLAFRTGKAKYNKLLGLWSLEKQNPIAANQYFAKIKDASADFFQAIALTEMDSLKQALVKWKALPESKETLQAISMLEKGGSRDEEKFFYAANRIPLADTLHFSNLLQSIANPELKARAILQRTRRWLEWDEVSFATSVFEKIRGLKVSKELLAEITYQNLRLVAAHKNWSALQTAIQNQKFDAWHSHDKIYYEALLAQQAGNKEECVKKCKQLMADDYLDEDFITAAVSILMKEKDRAVVFSQLSEAVLQRPYSTRLLKTYLLAVTDMGIQSEAEEALKKLRSLLPPPQFNRFVEAYPHFFSIQ